MRTVRVNDLTATLEWQRTHPLVASIRVAVQYPGAFPGDVARRDYYRAVWMVPPPVPIGAALATNGPVGGREGTLISGGDVALPGSPCGAGRDTASVAAVAAPQIIAAPGGSWPGAPLAVLPSASFLEDVRRVLTTIETRAPATLVGNGLRPLPSSRPWAAADLRGDTIAIAGPGRFSGLLVARGAVVLTGAIQVTGLMIIDGTLDASAAQLSVQGAVLSADTSARGVMLGAQSRLFYDRCAVQMALAAVARPSLVPFSLWHSLPR